MERHEILRVFPGKEEKVTDAVTVEVPLTLYVNEEEIVTLLASPSDLTELAIGFLFTSGLLNSFDEVKSTVVDRERWAVHLKLKNKKIDTRAAFKRMLTSGCGRGTLFYNAFDLIRRKKPRFPVTIDRNRIFSMMGDFQTRSSGFTQTGGVHSAALADRDNILMVREDIGRHNAIDKILGYALMNKLELKDKIVLSSGRGSS